MLITQHAPAMEPVGEPRSGRTILRMSGLRKTFGNSDVLRGVDAELHEGEVVLLTGENGSGKTTLLNILTGNLEPDAGRIEYLADDTPRSYEFPRPWWRELNPWDHFRPEFVAAEGIGRTWQDVRLFRSQSVADNIALAAGNNAGETLWWALMRPKFTRRKEREVLAESAAVLARLGLRDKGETIVDHLSYGQSKRVAIARAVTAGAKILFLDEPLAGLDQRGTDDCLQLLRSLVVNRNLTLVIIEHVLNQPQLRPLVTTMWRLEQGKLTATQVMEAPERGQHDRLRPDWMDRIASEGAVLLDEPLSRGALLTRIRFRGLFDSEARPALELRNVIVNRGNRTIIGMDDQGAITGIDLALQPGEIGILQAPNGWGKTTLLGAIAGLHPLASGSLCMNGFDLRSCPTWTRSQTGLRMSLGASYLFDSLTVNETLELSGVDVSTCPPLDFLAKRVSQLSGGQRQLLSLRTAVANGGSVTLFDEPFSQLDPANIDRAVALIRSRRHSCVLIAVPLKAEQEG